MRFKKNHQYGEHYLPRSYKERKKILNYTLTRCKKF